MKALGRRVSVLLSAFGICMLLLLASTHSYAQVETNGVFLKDSVKIGETVGFALSARYPAELDVVFPDSLYTFGTYELVNKRYFPTVTRDSTSYDSAIYEFITFELDTIQTLSLPVFLIGTKGDSIVFNSPEDEIVIRQLVEAIPDSVSAEAAPLIENTDFIRIPLAFNYPYFIAGVIILLVLAILTYIFFGKKISRYFKLRRLKKAHTKFLSAFNEVVEQSFDRNQAKQIDQLWKKYFEKLLEVPFTKMTTKEILNGNWATNINNELKAIDRILYSGKSFDQDDKPNYEQIKSYAENIYNEKVKEVNDV